ncbi:MAG: hypothetical protein DYG99_15400 [Bacteroidetes bacterium CHB5]|nr:hypothetical protein [Bacteroidetes bacterium CHB5]
MLKHFHYNILFNNRLKGIFLGVIAISSVALFVFSINNKAEQKLINSFWSLAFAFSLLGVLYLLGKIPFGQILEATDTKEIITFYQLGSFKFYYKKLGKPLNVILQQDQLRFYCLTIEMTNQNFIIEKYPTLNEANSRLAELKSVLYG